MTSPIKVRYYWDEQPLPCDGISNMEVSREILSQAHEKAHSFIDDCYGPTVFKSHGSRYVGRTGSHPGFTYTLYVGGGIIQEARDSSGIISLMHENKVGLEKLANKLGLPFPKELKTSTRLVGEVTPRLAQIKAPR